MFLTVSQHHLAGCWSLRLSDESHINDREQLLEDLLRVFLCWINHCVLLSPSHVISCICIMSQSIRTWGYIP